MVFDALKLVKPLLEGDEAAAWEVIQTYVQGGANSAYIYDVLLCKAMRHIGELWEANLISVADEHLASSVCDALLKRCEATRTVQPTQGKAMLFCIEGEQHDLGIKMVASCFAEFGFETRLYGKDLPLEYALLAALRWHPDIIGMSVSIVYHLPKLKTYVQELGSLAHHPTLLIGGRLAQVYDLHPYVGDHALIIHDILQLQEWLALRQKSKARAQ
ncbi:methanogenic corrinoid protein MtbC1 [Alicyclobacillus sacchari]|uniref:Methanogenic corrinoid protein MtbC1 n=1 Tax=Alicyclobacillus sacchari TaxID=392010 RepID=A0A4R8LKG5_9BACL|nr:cobalamin-dependent protein [Alicyclobacillus sacchari]TDY44610.1 methanogenic corrinoid protein MtbC1 [Alicyclobacillus sacchari]GMA57970.1 5-methyltetrahydrofolate--homocysteine methyltransferase [Alicyclobacillus sacchari]